MKLSSFPYVVSSLILLIGPIKYLDDTNQMIKEVQDKVNSNELFFEYSEGILDRKELLPIYNWSLYHSDKRNTITLEAPIVKSLVKVEMDSIIKSTHDIKIDISGIIQKGYADSIFIQTLLNQISSISKQTFNWYELESPYNFEYDELLIKGKPGNLFVVPFVADDPLCGLIRKMENPKVKGNKNCTVEWLMPIYDKQNPVCRKLIIQNKGIVPDNLELELEFSLKGKDRFPDTGKKKSVKRLKFLPDSLDSSKN